MSKPESQVGKSKIEIILLEGEEDVSNTVLIGGYFGLGRVGYLSVNHLLSELDTRLIGYITSDFIPPFVSVNDKKLRAPFELHRYQNIIILATHFEPYKYEQRSFAESIVKWAKANKIRNIVQVGGLDKRYQSDEEFTSVVVCSSTYDYDKMGPKVPMMDEGLYVTGPAALVMLYSEFYKVSSLLLLPFAERARPDPGAAAIALEHINSLFGIECNVDPLIDEGQSIEIEEAGAREIAEKEQLLSDNDSGLFV